MKYLLLDVYISETAHPDIRATLASLPGFADSLGISSIWILGHFTSYRMVAWFAVVPFILLIPIFCYLPETPYWLIEKGYNEQAEKALQFFRSNEDIMTEFQEIQNFDDQKKSKMTKSWNQTIKDLTSPSFIKPFSCIGVITALTVVAGFAVLANYVSEFMEASGSDINPTIGPMAIGFIRLALAIIVPWFIRKMNPKVSFAVGQSLMALTMTCIGIYYHAYHLYLNSLYIIQVNWIPLVMFILQFCIRTITIIPVLYSLLGELFPTEIRTLAVGITQSLEFGSGAIIVKFYPDMKYLMGLHGVCYLYASIGFFNSLWGYFTIPDNRSKTLVEIEEAYNK